MYSNCWKKGTQSVQILALIAHPSRGSFNHAILDRCLASLRGHEVIVHDLYAETFDPVFPEADIRRRCSFDPVIQRHMRDLSSSQGLIVIHPDWWGQPPAILKGWLDRVLTPGVAYEYQGPEFGTKHAVPLLNHVRAAVFVTSDALASQVAPLFDAIWRDRVFSFCGIESRRIELLERMRETNRRQREQYLCRVDAVMNDLVGRSKETNRSEETNETYSGRPAREE
ncbi:MAG: flavodoxin family protein [Spirochaetaceae bacterium]|nr:MAG: flavodoxin family protein [Spirochaetaceae bacterium]